MLRRFVNLLLLLIMFGFAAEAAAAARDVWKEKKAIQQKLHRGRVSMDQWSSAFPRSLAENPVFSQDGDRFGIEMKSTVSVGYYDRLFELPAAPGSGCRIVGDARTSGGNMYNNVMMIVSWLDEKDTVCQKEYVSFRDGAGKVRNFDEVFTIPEEAVKLELRCIAKWHSGKVTFGNIAVTAAQAPAKRMVRVAALSIKVPYHQERFNTPEENYAAFEKALTDLCENVPKLDLIVMPECMTNGNTGRAYPERAEVVPGGPTWNIVSRFAAKYKVNIIAGVVERDAQGCMHNSAFIADRQGKFAGVYRKVHLTVGESENGLIPGNGFPVFDLDFGKVGIMICWDNWFSESARLLKLNGAEIIAYPIAGDGQFEHREHVWPARAMDNAIPMVISLRNGGASRSCVIDRDGFIRAETTPSVDYAVSDLDLAWHKQVFWLSVGPCRGKPHQVYEFERRREVYGPAEKNIRDSK